MGNIIQLSGTKQVEQSPVRAEEAVFELVQSLRVFGQSIRRFGERLSETTNPTDLDLLCSAWLLVTGELADILGEAGRKQND